MCVCVGAAGHFTLPLSASKQKKKKKGPNIIRKKGQCGGVSLCLSFVCPVHFSLWGNTNTNTCKHISRERIRLKILFITVRASAKFTSNRLLLNTRRSVSIVFCQFNFIYQFFYIELINWFTSYHWIEICIPLKYLINIRKVFRGFRN